jgi:hypothetical protein
MTIVVIPVHDEAEAIARVVAGARRHAPVIVVDDGSGDGSAAEARRAGAEVIRHAARRGKAAALRTGFAAARARGASAVVTLDGDGQHDPDDIPRLLDALRRAPDCLVVGNRLGDTSGFVRARLNAMEVAAFFVEWVSALGVRDTQSGFRAYPLALLDDVGAAREGFVFETEVLVAAARRGWRVQEVGVASIPSARRRSRFRPLRDSLAIGAYLAREALARWSREIAARLAGRESGADRGAAKRGRVRAAATATVAAPLLAAAAVLQAGAGRLGLDLVSPLVRRLYACERLRDGAAPGRGLPDGVPPPRRTAGGLAGDAAASRAVSRVARP